MKPKTWWVLAKALEGVGMVLVLVGVMTSISYGLEDESLKSMSYELRGLMLGGGLFAIGWAIETRVGRG